jgi:hypothetical protein
LTAELLPQSVPDCTRNIGWLSLNICGSHSKFVSKFSLLRHSFDQMDTAKRIQVTANKLSLRSNEVHAIEENNSQGTSKKRPREK